MLPPRHRQTASRLPQNGTENAARPQDYAAQILLIRRELLLGFNAKGIVEYANPDAEQAFGRDPGALPGLNLEDLFPASGARLAGGWTEGHLWAVARREDGGKFPVKLSIDEIEPAGHLRRFVCRVQDIAEAQTDAILLPALIENIDGAVTLWDHADRLLLWNRHALAVYAPVSGAFRVGLGFTEFLTLILDQSPSRTETTGQQNFLHRHKTAHRKPAGKRIETLLGDRALLVDEWALGGDAIFRIDSEIPQQRQSEIEFRLAVDKAEAANVSKSNFLANMSHELRTPLNAIIGFSDIMKIELPKLPDTGKLVGYAQDIADSGAHLLELVNMILDLSRIEAGHHELHPEPLTPGDIIGDVVRLIQILAVQSEVQLVNIVPPNLPLLEADRPALRQVLLNILSNAIKFTPSGGSATVSAAISGEYLVISIADTGIGIAREDIPRLFKPFEQIEGAFSRSKAGTGIGLTITRKLVEMHAGELVVESELGKGTTMSISLPLAFSGTLPDAPNATR